MKRILIAVILCFASTSFADKPLPPPATDPADATNPKKKMPDKDKEPKVKKKPGDQDPKL